jgi:hypothetical protein
VLAQTGHPFVQVCNSFVDVPDEWGQALWESWTLVREVDADGKRERMQTDQLLLERLEGDRWRIRHMEWPRRGGR